MAGKGKTFADLVRDAIADMAEHGFDSADRVRMWEERLRETARDSMRGQDAMASALRDAMMSVYRRMVEKGNIFQYHEGLTRFTLDRVAPELRAELDRRMLASANLIRLNREDAINKTLRRFSGWATSIPKGGSDQVDKKDARESVRKALTQLPFEERRVLIDQGHKLVASINEVVATGGGAIALIWRSHWRQPGYNYREDHKDRDGQIYLLRESWAREAGLVKAGTAGYYDQVTAVAQEPFCRCYATYLYNPGSLPRSMLTKKGETALAEAREKARAA